METYTQLRAFADSWAVLALMLFFLGMIAFLFRPGGRRRHEDAATSIFRHDDRPAPATAAEQSREARP